MACSASIAFFLASPAQAFEVYFNDFDGNQTSATGVSAQFGGSGQTVSVQNLANLGSEDSRFSGSMWQNSSTLVGNGRDQAEVTRLVLTGLPSHDSIDVNFLLGVLDSWDGDDDANHYDPDAFNVRVASLAAGQGAASVSVGDASVGAVFDGDSVSGDIFHHENYSGTAAGDDLRLDKVEHHANVTTQDGNDRVVLGKLEHHSNVSTGNGNDFLDLDKLEHHANATLGDGDDGAVIDKIEHHSAFSAGSGNDTLVLGKVESYSSVSAGSGDDYVRFDRDEVENGAVISGGSGTDSIELTQISRADYEANEDHIRDRLVGFENFKFSDGQIIGDASAFAGDPTDFSDFFGSAYQYPLELSAAPGAQITLSSLPAGTSLSGITANGDGSYTLTADSNGRVNATLVSSSALSQAQEDALSATVSTALTALTGVDQSVAFSETFSNFSLNDQSASDPEARLLSFGGGSRAGSQWWSDSSYEISLSAIAHDSSTLIIDFYASGVGWQGGQDESWALENLSISLNGVGSVATPLAPTGLLMLPALALLWRRQRA